MHFFVELLHEEFIKVGRMLSTLMGLLSQLVVSLANIVYGIGAFRSWTEKKDLFVRIILLEQSLKF